MLLVAAMLPMVRDKIMDSKHTYALISRTCESVYQGKKNLKL